MAAVQPQTPPPPIFASFGWHITKLAANARRLRARNRKASSLCELLLQSWLLYVASAVKWQRYKADLKSEIQKSEARERMRPRDHDHKFMRVVLCMLSRTYMHKDNAVVFIFAPLCYEEQLHPLVCLFLIR